MSARALVVGGGHNGLICAAYLARAGLAVTLLERRDVLGGACVTEPLWPGYRVSRAAYVLSLFRPAIARELELERHGLVLLPRVPSSLTPLPDGRALVLGRGQAEDAASIAQFSHRDAERYAEYERWLEGIAGALEPLLDEPLGPGALARAALRLGRRAPDAARLLLGPARPVLEAWFESEPLRATLATDAIIGAFAPPSARGTGYVLFHHVMGELGGRRGVWAYVRGGMGALADALAAAARAAGAELRTKAEVVALRCANGRVRGVTLASGEALDADVVVSGADAARTASWLEDATLRAALAVPDLRSPVVKINAALGELPRFPSLARSGMPLCGTIHLGPTDLDGIERAYRDAAAGRVSSLPVVELTLPSTLDDSLAPPGRYVASLFVQYAPVLPRDDAAWPHVRALVRERALAAVEALAPGFTASIEHLEVLAAPDLEDVFGLGGGNIFHGAMTPWRRRPGPRTRVPGLWLCGSGAHPGGGVLGAPGRNAAHAILRARPTPSG